MVGNVYYQSRPVNNRFLSKPGGYGKLVMHNPNSFWPTEKLSDSM
jgi:hypothetical protein